MYPDFDGQSKETTEDPRENYLNKHIIGKLPQYAFPLGFKIKYEEDRPSHEILPMIFDVGEDKTYLQYLIFYESLSEQYKPAYDLYQKAQENIDEMVFDEPSRISNTSNIEINEP